MAVGCMLLPGVPKVETVIEEWLLAVEVSPEGKRLF